MQIYFSLSFLSSEFWYFYLSHKCFFWSFFLHAKYTLLVCPTPTPFCRCVIFQYCYRYYKNDTSSVYREIFAPFIFAPFALVVKSANLRLDKFQYRYLKLSLLKHICIWENSRRGKTVWRKLQEGENNPVYNISPILRDLCLLLCAHHLWKQDVDLCDLSWKNCLSLIAFIDLTLYPTLILIETFTR